MKDQEPPGPTLARGDLQTAVRPAADPAAGPVGAGLGPRGRTHRDDIDGLRAVAVLPVLLFHAGVPGFAGGYVGVDVFFVISGYLITTIIHRELKQGRFSIAKFYERRVRRIFPALFVLLAAVFAGGYAMLVPPDLAQLGKSIFATALFVSNIFFYRQSGYFDTAADAKPLLHTWSLAVEEQYYILFPLALLLVYRWRRNWLVPAVAVATIASFAASTATVLTDPVAAFFLPHSRAWELLLGSCLSFTSPRRVGALAWGGLLAIGVSVFAYSQATLFPGPLALLPCLGAAAVLMGADGTSAGRLLSHPVLTYVGKISYSLYLWHWPILVFVGFAVGDTHWVARAALCLPLSFGIASLSWRYVEMPFRRRGQRATPALFAGGAAIAVGAVAGLAATTGFPGRLPPRAAALAAAATGERHRPVGCFYAEGANPDSIAAHCFAQGPYRTVIWGDSHALQYSAPMAAMLSERVGLMGRGGCAPLDLTPVRSGRRPDLDCSAFNRAVLQAIVDDQAIQTVILSARWARFTFPMTDDEAQSFVDVPEMRRTESMIASLDRVIAHLRAAKKKVVVIGPEPEFRTRLPTCLARAAWLNRPEAICAHRSLTLPGSPADVALRRLSDRRRDFLLYQPAQAICPGGHCLRTLRGVPVMRDADHFTDQAAARVVQQLVTSPGWYVQGGQPLKDRSSSRSPDAANERRASRRSESDA